MSWQTNGGRGYKNITSFKKSLIKILGLVILAAGGLYFVVTDGPSSLSAMSVSERANPDRAGAVEEASGRDDAGVCRFEPGFFERQALEMIHWEVVRDEIRSGESLSHVLDRVDVCGDDGRAVAAAISEIEDLTKIRPGAEVVVYRDRRSQRPIRLTYQNRNRPRVLLLPTPNGWTASTLDYQPVSCADAAGGTIKSTLWGSAVQLYDLEPELVLSFTDIFRFDVDFVTEVQEGDQFKLLYETRFCQGEPVGVGRILAAEFTNSGRTIKAFYFQNEDGAGAYYDENGESLKKMFLKSPLQYRRISSHFSNARHHPILKITRPHHGVDYAAPSGTPVEAMGDGRVTYAGRRGGYGNLIEIKHNGSYTTMYAHLKGFAQGIKRGVRVEQGQLIGYVGSTGLSTGPHLDFRVKENGQFIDPLSMKLQPAEPIPAEKREDYKALVASRQAQMRRLLAEKTAVRVGGSSL
jgi:murein DD-endopeptidase MepM/ murein hydrolase activator NlpD